MPWAGFIIMTGREKDVQKELCTHSTGMTVEDKK